MFRSVVGLLLALLALTSPVRGEEATPLQSPDYVGSATCAGCHQDVTARWQTSDHAKAWTEATAENIVADFNDTTFAHDGMTAAFHIDGDGTYRITVTEKDGTTRDYPVHSVAGIEPLQQYLLETEPGRLQSFDVVWDTKKQRWFHLYPDQDLPPNDGLHWTGPYKNWNGRCAVCHSTGYEKNYDPQTKRYASTEVEIGVGCEACHGPGSAHVASAKEWDAKGSAPLPNAGFAVDFSDPETTIQQCAGCHSRREPLQAGSPAPGTPYHDAYNLSLLMPGLYHADGQVQDEVYVYGSFLQSKMYEKGVSCTDCHEPHTMQLVAEGNAVCTQCHSPAGNPAFPSLRQAEYDSPDHHFHEPGNSGAACKNCHMVEHVYMGNDWRADHSFRIPRPDLSAKTGSPDACTTCHSDRPPAWAASVIAEHYPDSDHRGPHYGEIFAESRSDPAGTTSDLSALAADPKTAGIVRATALAYLGQSGNPALADQASPLLADEDPLVRASAVDLQRLLPPQERADRLVPLLSDPARTVRIAAARAMLDVPMQALASDASDDLRRAMDDWQTSMASRLDYPETHLQLAGIALTRRDWPAATAAFREVVDMDPQRVEAWVMLTRIAAALQGPTNARTVLDEALQANPTDPTLNALKHQMGPR
ncbi:multiheme c-type cytochrome [Amorphus sp. 3PC139-8]|uniref:multiheme c-type cytochrome n=1 Tax=Amorphus sp. 3PC139-8 TaxID=2735676 RepID=UPI00345C8FE5